MRDDRERLLDIQEAIERIEKYADKEKNGGQDDELIIVWIVHHLQIIGEACASMSKEFMEQHPEIPWREIVGMRNILVHHYFEVDDEAVWSAVLRDIPDLKEKIAVALKSIGND